MKFMNIHQKTWLRGYAGNPINRRDIPDELGNPFQSALDEISVNDEEIHSLIVENQKLREALSNIARQHTHAEMDVDIGDVEYGFDAMINEARTALSVKGIE